MTHIALGSLCVVVERVVIIMYKLHTVVVVFSHYLLSLVENW